MEDHAGSSSFVEGSTVAKLKKPIQQCSKPLPVDHRGRECASAVPAVLPSEGFVRLRQIIGDRKSDPPVVGVIPVSRATWWRGVKNGRYPVGIKLGDNTTAWRVEEIRAVIGAAG